MKRAGRIYSAILNPTTMHPNQPSPERRGSRWEQVPPQPLAAPPAQDMPGVQAQALFEHAQDQANMHQHDLEFLATRQRLMPILFGNCSLSEAVQAVCTFYGLQPVETPQRQAATFAAVQPVQQQSLLGQTVVAPQGQAPMLAQLMQAFEAQQQARKQAPSTNAALQAPVIDLTTMPVSPAATIPYPGLLAPLNTARCPYPPIDPFGDACFHSRRSAEIFLSDVHRWFAFAQSQSAAEAIAIHCHGTIREWWAAREQRWRAEFQLPPSASISSACVSWETAALAFKQMVNQAEDTLALALESLLGHGSFWMNQWRIISHGLTTHTLASASTCPKQPLRFYSSTDFSPRTCARSACEMAQACRMLTCKAHISGH